MIMGVLLGELAGGFMEIQNSPFNLLLKIQSAIQVCTRDETTRLRFRKELPCDGFICDMFDEASVS